MMRSIDIESSAPNDSSLTTVEDSQDSITEASSESIGKNERGEWISQTESLLTAISLTVGLGSLWRFPRLAYQNGGSAFLLPYSACMILFGFPMLYLEMMLGQYASQGPSTLFGHFIPALQGLGWTMAFISFTVGVYYCVIVAWSLVYLFASIAGQTSVWGKCNNAWNDIYCVDAVAMKECKLRDPTKPIAFNGSCFASVVEEMKTPYDQYFTNVITRRSDGIDTFGGINWATFFALTIIWLLVALTIMKGYVYVGKTAYVVSVMPYVIVVIVFCRAVTLEGATAGVFYYFGKPDFRTLLYHETWSAALIQVCFTLNIGYGGIIMIASYNRRHNNCYRDAWITVAAVVLMSIAGGVVVFATLGFISQQLNKPLHGIVSSGLSIVFVAYLEAMEDMPYPFIWSMLFFATLLFLGFGSVMVFAETICTCIYDQWPSTREFKWIIALFCSALHLFFGIIMTTESGFFWFTLFDEVCVSTSICLVVSLEAFMLMHVYGFNNIQKITVNIFGERPKGEMAKFGPHSRLWECCWKFIIPAIGLMHSLFTLLQKDPVVENYSRRDQFPHWAVVIGRFLKLLPLVPLPVFFFVNLAKWKMKKLPLITLFIIPQPFQPRPAGTNAGEDNNSSILTGTEGSSTISSPPAPSITLERAKTPIIHSITLGRAKTPFTK